MTEPILVTMGEPAGIGPEITLKAWMKRKAASLQPFVFLGDARSLNARAAAFGLDVAIAVIEHPKDAAGRFPDALPVLDMPLETEARLGNPHPNTAYNVLAAIRHGVALLQDGIGSALVTNPIQKHVLKQAGFDHPGHTEYLADLTGITPIPTPVMMLAAPDLKVVPVTIHTALANVPNELTTAKIVKTGQITADGLKRYFSIKSPRLAIAGLNPHAGEGGIFGTEDRDVVAPAVAALQADGIDAVGPIAADSMFHDAARARYDAALCMYHDQALIPVKTLSFDTAVNVTLGLPFIRTSPDHGTALNIAGNGTADPTSLIAALRMAQQMAGQPRLTRKSI